MSNATFVKDVSADFNGEARLYSTDDEVGHVVVSSVASSFVNETMVFPADENGEVSNWGELGVVKFSGGFTAALADAGYVLA